MSLSRHQNNNLKDTEVYVRNYFAKESSGHDWWHISRVCTMTLKIAEKEGGDRFVLEMAALLHDLDDWKLGGDPGESKIKVWLDKIKVPEKEQNKIIEVIEQVSFKGAQVENKAITLEAQIVQDADRLDAIGAIGIARTFAYGGSKNRLIYDPEVKPEIHTDFEAYKNNKAPTINHFYEKLLLLKNRLNTNTAKQIAQKRQVYMEEFLMQFYAEWEGRS